MLLGSDGLGWIAFDDYELAQTIGIVALALILFEGGLTAGLHRDPAGARGRRSAWRPSARSITAVISGVAATGPVRPLAARGPAARRDPLLDRRRRDLRAAARLDAAPAPGAHARGRVGLQRPDRRPARPRVHRVDPAARLRHRRTCSSSSSRRSGSASRSACAIGWLAVQAFQRARLATAGLYPVASLATAGLAFGLADALHGSGFLAVYLAGLALGGGADPRQADDHRVPRRARLGRAARDVPHARPARLPEPARRRRARGRRARARRRRRRPAAGGGRRHAPVRLQRRRAARPRAGRACAARCPWCSRRSRSSRASRAALEFFNIVFFAVLLSTLLQGTTFEALGKRLGRDDERARAAAAARRGRDDPAARRRDPRVPDRARRRDRRRPRARPRAAARRGRQRDRPRRRGDPAARVDAAARRRPGPRPAAPARRPHAGPRAQSSAGATGPIGPPPRPPRRQPGPHAGLLRVALAPRATATRRARRASAASDVVAQLRDPPRRGRRAVGRSRTAATRSPARSPRSAGAASCRRGRGGACRRAEPDERAWLQTVIGALAADVPE